MPDTGGSKTVATLPMEPKDYDTDNERDKRLIEDFYRGDESAFDKLTGIYYKLFYWISFHYLRNKEDAEDCVQESLIKIYETRNNNNRWNEGKGCFIGWACTIVRNTALNHLKKRKRKARDISLDETYPTLDNDTSISREGIPDETVANRSLILSCLDRLTENEKFIVILHIAIGLKQKEIAVLMGISAPRVNQILREALSKLRTCLAKQMKNQGGR